MSVAMLRSAAFMLFLVSAMAQAPVKIGQFWGLNGEGWNCHAGAAWGDEQDQTGRYGPTFYAYDYPAAGTEQLYFYAKGNHYTTHFSPALEGEVDVTGQHPESIFYAFRTQVPGTELIHQYWDQHDMTWSYHTPPAWNLQEDQTSTVCPPFYAFTDATPLASLPPPPPPPQPQAPVKIGQFWGLNAEGWNCHAGAAWGDEQDQTGKFGPTFYAYDYPAAGTEQLYFYAKGNHHTTHFPPALAGEVDVTGQHPESIFYAFRTQVPGTELIHQYWDQHDMTWSYHTPPAWYRQEDQTSTVCPPFYAFTDATLNNVTIVHTNIVV